MGQVPSPEPTIDPRKICGPFATAVPLKTEDMATAVAHANSRYPEIKADLSQNSSNLEKLSFTINGKQYYYEMSADEAEQLKGKEFYFYPIAIADTQATAAVGTLPSKQSWAQLAANRAANTVKSLSFTDVLGGVATGIIIERLVDYTLNSGLTDTFEGPLKYPIYNDGGALIGWQIHYRASGETCIYDFATGKTTQLETRGIVKVEPTIDTQAGTKPSNTTDAINQAQNDPGWKPPDKNHCGENIERHFAIMLFQELLALKLRNTERWQNQRDFTIFDDKNIPMNNTESIDKEEKLTHARLAEKKCDQYYQDGRYHSVFMDYKIMRERWLMKRGKELGFTGEDAVYAGFGDLVQRLDLKMSVEEALTKCMEVITTWWP